MVGTAQFPRLRITLNNFSLSRHDLDMLELQLPKFSAKMARELAGNSEKGTIHFEDTVLGKGCFKARQFLLKSGICCLIVVLNLCC